MERNWYEIKNVSAKKSEIFIYDEIGYWGKTAADFVNEFNQIDSSEIDLHIDSPGGSVHMGMAIHNVIKASSKTVNVFIDGMAASIASVIAVAGDSIIMPNNALFMIHNPMATMVGGSEDFRKEANLLDKIQGQMAQVYINKTGKNIDEIKSLMDEETWFTGNEAKAFGFVDKTTYDIEIAARFDIEKFNFKNLDKYNSFKKTQKPDCLGGGQELNTNPKQTHKKEDSVDPKTIEELTAKYPELVKAIQEKAKSEGVTEGMAEGISSESARIKGIEELAGKGTEEIISKAKADPKATKESVAIAILEAQHTAGKSAIDALENDGKEVADAVNEIGAPANLSSDEDSADLAKSEKEAKEIADALNAERV